MKKMMVTTARDTVFLPRHADLDEEGTLITFTDNRGKTAKLLMAVPREDFRSALLIEKNY